MNTLLTTEAMIADALDEKGGGSKPDYLLKS